MSEAMVTIVKLMLFNSRLANLNLRNGITKNDRSTIIEIAIF